ncbi:ABC transporter ATP-binding protein [Thalassospira alkalitolerans]|uniref:ABC transporter ATP-binding protein n=1 Tax=Thalassospira alkalitolerans TaxID=1293890 RepID=UPI003AA9C61D
MSDPKFMIRNLTKSYGEYPVLERINLDIETGAFCTLVGASGCGKSTFLRLLLSQELPSGGDILMDGKALPQQPTPDRGIVFQRYSVFPHLTVAENLMIGAEFTARKFTGRLFGNARKQARNDIAELLETIGLSPAANKYPSQLSGGMQQRLAIAQALTMKPGVLLLDEPFGALDPGIRNDMHELLLGLWKTHAMTIFMVTHDIHEAFKLGTRMLVFDKLRDDPHAPEAYGATITYDLPIDLTTAPPPIPGRVFDETDGMNLSAALMATAPTP